MTMTTGEWIGTNLVPTLTGAQYFGLALVVAVIAGALCLEHYAVGRRAWPKRHYYALGLVTDAGLLLLWAGAERIALNVGTGLLLTLAACLAGAPDWILLQRRERRLAIAWREMTERNKRLASDLARAMVLVRPRDRARIQDMVEGIGFTLGCMRQDLADMQIIASHLEPLLEQFLILAQDGQGPPHDPAD